MADSDAHKCAFSVQIDVALEEQAFHAPSFRFRFLDGTKKQTPVVGAAGWTALDPETPGSWRFEAAIPDVLVTEALACAIDDDPIIAFVLSDQANASAAGGAAPANGGKGVDSKGKASAPHQPEAAVDGTPRSSSSSAGVKKASSGRGRLIADWFELDASALLAPDRLQLEHTWRGSSAAADQETQSIHHHHDDDGYDTQSIFAHLKKVASKAEQQHSASRSCFAPHSGIRFVTVRISVDQPLLSLCLRKKLNPLAITVGTARRLPGVGQVRSIGAGQTPHSALARSCRPVYAQWRFFPDKTLGVQPRDRLVLTPGRAHAETVDWQHTTTFLCGRCDATQLYDAIQASALTVEIHDRDFFQDDALHKLQLKWEALFTTGVDPTRPSTTPTTDTVASSSANPSRHPTPRSHATQPPAKPLEAFAVDEIAKHDWHALLSRSGESFAFGSATFRLDELLLKAKALVPPPSPMDPSHTKPYMKLKLTADVLARKRRAQPIGAADLAETEGNNTAIGAAETVATDRAVRDPGAYVVSGTTLSLHVSLQHPIQPASSSSSAPSLFSRFVLIFPYNDSSTLAQLMRVVESVNLQAFADSTVSIRSYQLTAQEKQQCDSGQLDVITGCMVIDDDLRMVVVEGLADGAMKRVHSVLPRTKPQSDSFRMYANDALRFTHRLYTPFEIDLKRIKLRYALPTLLKMPDIYMRTKVAEPCYAALTKLMEMRRVSRLADVKEMDLFPSAHMLLAVESKYGESISLEDIYGKKKKMRAEGAAPPSKSSDGDPASNNDDEFGGDDDDAEGRAASAQRAFKYTHWKAPTDSTNPLFETAKRTRQDKDFVEERRKLLEQQQLAYRQKRQEEDEQLKADPRASQPVYLYSGQKLRSQDALQEELRKRLSSDHKATYTYGAEFQSLAMSLVNPDELRQTEEREARTKWTTQRGFVYPMPRPTAEYYTHADAPSEARCEDLREPFIDNVNHPKPVSRENNRERSGPEFSTLPSKDLIFGGTNGDGSVNPDYFKSVHLCGDGLRKEMEEALQQEQDEWERKVVVDRKQIKFLAHGNICSLPPSKGPQSTQLDKLRDILNGPVQSKPLRIVKNATLPSGKRVPLLPPPASIMSLQEYSGPVAATFAKTLRHSDHATTAFVATDATGKPKDFHFPSITDLLTPPVKKNTTYKEIRPVRQQEKAGFLWRNPPS